MTEVVVINGSPRLNKGNTAMVLNPFIEGMEAAGAKISLYHASKLTLKQCNCGNLHCWNKAPGICIHHDDMQIVLEALKRAEILVLGIPMYSPLPGAMQTFLNRLCPIIDPILSFREERTRAKIRKEDTLNTIVLVGICGWWEIENLDTIVRIVREIADDASITFAGAILRPHVDVLRFTGQDVLENVKIAGSELITTDKLDSELLTKISRPLIPLEKYIDNL